VVGKQQQQQPSKFCRALIYIDTDTHIHTQTQRQRHTPHTFSLSLSHTHTPTCIHIHIPLSLSLTSHTHLTFPHNVSNFFSFNSTSVACLSRIGPIKCPYMHSLACIWEKSFQQKKKIKSFTSRDKTLSPNSFWERKSGYVFWGIFILVQSGSHFLLQGRIYKLIFLTGATYFNMFLKSYFLSSWKKSDIVFLALSMLKII